jgi:hypothetical protein
MPETLRHFREVRRRIPVRGRFVAAITLLGLVAFLAILIGLRAPTPARERAIEFLSEHFNSEVDIESLRLSLVPRASISGAGLVMRHRDHLDGPPLVSIERFSADAGLLGLLWRPRRIRLVRLEGLQIHIPPRWKEDEEEKQAPEGTPVVIDEIVAENTELVIATRREDKPPRVFQIHHLRLLSAALDRPMTFAAALTNPIPEGEIESQGRFGPWNRDEPSLTPVSGTYALTEADLGTIDGIGGTLTSRGEFSGVLERIEVEGATETPDFVVDVAGQPVPLSTRFRAVVDGTSGDTILEAVHAQVLESSILASGGVIRSQKEDGRVVSLEVEVDRARIEDLMRLAVKAPRPPMTGFARISTTFLLPPGQADVVRRLQLDGEFSIESARFTDVDVQKSIETLSERGRGKSEAAARGESVVSDMRGRFVLRNGQMRFSSLSFGVPGAMVQLKGHYDIPSETLDFRGTLSLDASLSETTTGWRSALLKVIDPVFRRGKAGAVLPIKVDGDRENPSFGLDVGRAITGR